MPYPRLPFAAAFLALALPAAADDVNIYSSRHYETDERLYSDFTDQTGIQVNRIEGQPEELIARMQAEGANSPADIFITVDAGRIWLADQEGLLQPIHSEILDARIPAHLRHPDGDWYGFSQRARIIFYAKDRVPNPPQTYDALADPEWKGRICIRSALELLQPVADGGDDRQRGRRQGPRLGHRPARQPRPPAGGCRHRPAQGPGLRRMRHRRGQHLLFRPGAGRAGRRRQRGHRQHRLGLPRPGRPPAPTSTSPPPASPRTRRTPTPRSPFSNT